MDANWTRSSTALCYAQWKSTPWPPIACASRLTVAIVGLVRPRSDAADLSLRDASALGKGSLGQVEVAATPEQVGAHRKVRVDDTRV